MLDEIRMLRGLMAVVFGTTVAMMVPKILGKRRRVPRVTRLTVYDLNHASPEIWVANQEIVAYEEDGLGHYRFFLPNNKVMSLNLSKGKFRLVMHETRPGSAP